MSVYTTLSNADLQQLLTRYNLGELIEYQGILDGITNTIYRFKTTKSQYILTLFEELTAQQLPFYIDLMTYLAQRGYACPMVLHDSSDNAIQTLHGKPAVIISFLPGKTKTTITHADCEAIGFKLAELHIAALDFDKRLENPRDFAWMHATAEELYPSLSTENAELIKNEIEFQRRASFEGCPRGIIHGDLFRDNVLFENGEITGVLDLYYACYDYLAYDVAITVNDWCLRYEPDESKTQLLLQSYQDLRPFTQAEQQAWPVFLRRSALRYWLSRLYDFQHQSANEDVQVKDPDEFKALLLYHLNNQ